MNKKQKIWVLTFECNDHDQHGEYFKAAFANKPTIGQLAEVMRGWGDLSADVMTAVAFLERLLEGGGRHKDEHVWYNLTERELL